MTEETYSVYELEETGNCILCGSKTKTVIHEANDRAGSTSHLCKECGQNLFNRLIQDKNFREIARQQSW